MDLIKELSVTPLYLVPFLTFIVGAIGSIHCVSMCGGLIIASTNNFKSNLIYQVARLLGYVTMGTILHFFGRQLILTNMTSISLAAEWIIALIFVLIGFKLAANIKMSTPKFLEKLNQKIFRFSLKQKNIDLKALMVGYFSVLLPCGYLYTFLFGLLAVDNFFISIMSMMTFWLATLPALLFGTHLIKNQLILKYLPQKRVMGIIFLCIGVFTLINQLENKYYFKEALY